MYKIPANTLFLGKQLVFVPECHSTNTLALELSQKPTTAEGAVVITNNQTAGRGQRGNLWEASPGLNLTFSLILKPTFLPVKDQFYLSMVTSLALLDHLSESISGHITIKWPNDILVHKKKICGILIENQVQGKMLQSAVVGIGLNVNQPSFSVQTATSVYQVTQKESDLPETLERLLGRLEARYLQLKNDRRASLQQDYLEHLHWKGERHLFIKDDQPFEGTITSVDESGRLIVETGDGPQHFGVKEIKYLK